KPAHRRRRTLSTASISANNKIEIVLASTDAGARTEQHAAAGAFTLTGSAHTALLEFVPYGDPRRDHGKRYAHRRTQSSYAVVHWPTGSDSDSPPASPSSELSVPSISRTASDGDAAWRPHTGRRKRDKEKAKERPRPRSSTLLNEPTGIHPVLSKLESRSRVGTGRVVCAGCGQAGTNFPRCPRCGQMWCSRECRTGPTHQCGSRRT
ncbi:hypothetical protein FB45DRAFT_752206, partial [Roridomyces roridus]